MMETLAKPYRRFYEIDFTRSLPILCLPFVHVLDLFYLYGFTKMDLSVLDTIGGVASAIGAPVFMLCLGMNIAFSRHTSPRELARRGLIMILIFYAHNLLRYTIPMFALDLAEGEFDWAELAMWTFGNDILMFAALSFLCFALFKKLRLGKVAILAVSILLSGIGTAITPLLENVPCNLGGLILSHYTYVPSTETCFPLSSWLLYPAVGFVMGSYIVTIPDEDAMKRFYNRIFIAGLAVFITLYACLLSYGVDAFSVFNYHANSYYTDLCTVVLDIAASCMAMAVMYYIFRLVRSEKLIAVCTKISNCIMVFYLLHWVITTWLGGIACIWFENTHSLPLIAYFLFSGLVAGLSLWLAIPIQKKLDAMKAASRAKRTAVNA